MGWGGELDSSTLSMRMNSSIHVTFKERHHRSKLMREDVKVAKLNLHCCELRLTGLNHNVKQKQNRGCFSQISVQKRC